MIKKLTNNSRGLISTINTHTHTFPQPIRAKYKKETNKKITHERGDSPSLPVHDLNKMINKNTENDTKNPGRYVLLFRSSKLINSK